MQRIKIMLLAFTFISLTFQIESNSTFAQLRWFDIYTSVTPKEERFHLDNFAYHLKTNPELIGYIGYFNGKNTTVKEINRRARNAVKYLTKEFGLPKSRFVLIYVGSRSETRFILQPARSTDPPPKFLPE